MQKTGFALARGHDVSAWIAGTSAAQKFLFVIFGSFLLAASAWIEMPMVPVPMTMQTYALLLIGAFLGSRLAFVSALAYLLEGALGLPVFAGAPIGLAHFGGPTGGYLVAFPFAAAFVGFAAERGWLKNLIAAFAVMLASHAIVFAGGLTWLTQLIGWEKAIAAGLTPFILGTLVKCALAVATVQLCPRRK